MEEEWRDCIDLVESTFTIGPYSFQVTQQDELPLAASLFMLAEMHETDSEISGTRLWAGSHGLATYLLEHPDLVQDKNMLELGAGTGIGAMMSCRLGAAKITSTDGDVSVVEILRHNFQQNNCQADGKYLFWGEETSIRPFKDLLPDIVIAGDVLYKAALIEPFFNTIKELATTHVTVILCHIPRADVTHQVIQKRIQQFGFQIQSIESLSETARANLPSECPLDDIERARIYILSL